MEEADCVVVGAGPGGAAAAARLAADPRLRVLLLEAGEHGGWRGAAPGYRPRPPEPIAWRWATEPQLGLRGRRLFHPAGRVVGGSSAIGWGMALAGDPADADAWAAAGLTGWSWPDVEPAYRRVAEALRPVIPPPSAATRALLAAAHACGEPLIADLAAPDARGAAPLPLAIRDGARWHAGRAWLDAAAHRPNLRVLPGALAERVLFEGGRTWGMRYLHHGEPRTVRARRAVLLAAGAIGTPLLLLRSGIGPTRDLLDRGIPVVAPSPLVGEGLAEGVALAMPFTAPSDAFHTSSARTLAARIAWILGRRGPLAEPPVTAALLLRAGPSSSPLTAALLFSPRLMGSSTRPDPPGRGFTLTVAVPHPFARGRVRLGGVAARDRPHIDPGLLGDPRDVATLRWARETALRIAATPPLAAFTTDAPADNTAIERLIRARTEGLHQPAGTAAIGTAPNAVCDPQLRVRGVDDLWVADLSALPAAPLAGVATAAMVGERCADFVMRR